jgi:hypothetical protein
VDHAVADRVRWDVVVDGVRHPAFDEVALEARGARVDDENVQLGLGRGEGSSTGCDGRCEARTQGAPVSAVIRARLRTQSRAVQRGQAAQLLTPFGAPMRYSYRNASAG